MDRRRAAGVLLALAACVAYATAAPTASNHTTLDLYDGAPDGCYYNFQHYGEGDRIMTNEPCLNCTCHNRMLMCYLRVCPFTKPIGQDCTIEKRADQCCPIVTCPDVPVDLLTSTTTSPAEYGATGLGKLDKFGCSIHGKYFPEGSKVPPTPNKPCEHCYCIRNMTTCVMQECTLHVDGCTPIYHKDVCCPVRYSCDHPEDEMPLLDDLSTTVRPTPGFLLTTTTLSPVTQMSQDCLFENQIISDGSLIKTEKACDHCYCMKGDIVCVVQECGTPMENEGKNCTALAPREGVCCPDTYICEGDEPTTGTYESLDYTTELEKLTTLTPPRRAGSEGSGYRNEPDGIFNTEVPAFETETEGSGYEQATIHPADELPDRHKIEPSNEVSSTVEPHEFIAITTSKESDSDQAGVITESGVHKDTTSHQYEPSTTSTYISQKVDESSTAIAQGEDIGSGEEDIKTPDEIVSASSASPDIEVSEPTVTTIESNAEDDSGKVPPTIIAPVVDESNLPKEQSTFTADSAIELTTETYSHLDDDENIKGNTIFDEQYHATEYDLLQTTTVPTDQGTEKNPTTSPKQDTTTIDLQHYSISTSAPGYEDEIATTESQDVVTDGFEDTGTGFGVHHQMAVTASTPLLEEIEKDTSDEEHMPAESTQDKFKTSTTSLNHPTEETINKDTLKPDLTDKTMSANIPTTVPQKTQETDVEDSSELQQHPSTTITPDFDDGTKKTPTSDSVTTPESQTSQETDIEESSESQQYASTTFESDAKKTTPSDSMSFSESQEGQETDIEESSKPEPYAPTTSAPAFEDKKTTQSDTMATTKLQGSQEIDFEESSELQQYGPTTSAPIFEDDREKTTPSDSLTTSRAQEVQGVNVEESSEAQQYTPTTSVPLFEGDTKKTTPSDSMATSKSQESHVIDVEESSEPNQYVSTTSSPTFEDEKTKPSDSTTTSKIQEDQETEVDESSKPQPHAPTTSAPAFEDQKTTSSETMDTSKVQESQEIDVEESSEAQHYAPTTSSPTFEDELKKTTLSEPMTTSKTQEDQKTDVQESSKPQQNVPTISVPSIEDEIKETTPSDSMTTHKIQGSLITDVDESSEAQEFASTTSVPAADDETKKIILSVSTTTAKTQENQETGIEESSEPQQYAPTTSVPTFEDDTKITTPSVFITTKTQESKETDVEASSEPQQHVSTTSDISFEDELKKTTTPTSITTFKTQEDQKADVEESSEPQQNTFTTSAPTFEDEVKDTTPSDSITAHKTQDGQKPDVDESLEAHQYGPTTSASLFVDDTMKTSTATSFDQKEITTAEPDKGLNTIPSGSVEEETTESPELEKHTYGNELVPTESATEFENKLGDKIESITDYTSLTSDTSASKEDPLILTTESTTKEDIEKIGSTQSADITKYTTELASVSEEAISTHSHDHPSSSELPASEYQQTATSSVAFGTETIKQSTESPELTATPTYYESTSQVTKLENSTSEKHEAITNAPSYLTVPPSTIADLEENEIINESRIPGEGDCLLNGVTYRNESTVPSSNKCQSGCRCSSSIIKCDPIICSPPPEYMDNCETTYDSLDSCCPTYVCDHKTETMPPQSHSQMSGTEAPIVPPIECKGDECVLGDDKKHSVETSELCKSGSCTSQFPSNIPEQPEADRHEGCKGNECTSSDSIDQLLCSKENDCQASPVKPCEGAACKDLSDISPPQKQQPCIDGNNCDVPVKDCSAGGCDSGGEDIALDIENECTEKSCKRKDEFEIQQPPKKCSGSDCPSIDFTSEIEKLTTMDNLNIVTEKIEKSSVPTLPTTTDRIENQDTIKDINDYIDTKTSTIIPEKINDDESTQAEDKVYTKSPDLSSDNQSTTETAEEIKTYPPKTHTEEKPEVTKLPLELDNQETTTLVSIERDTEPSKTHVIEQQTTQQPGKDIPESTPTSLLEEMITKPPKIQLEADDNTIIPNIEEVTKSPADKNEDATSKTSAIYDMEDATKLPQISDVQEATTTVNEEIDSTTLKTNFSNSHEATKSTQVPTVSEDMTIQVSDTTVTEPSKPHVTDIVKFTQTTNESQNGEATTKSTNDLTTKSEVSDNQESTNSPDRSESDEITTKQYIEEKSTELSKPYEVTKSPEITQNEITTTAITPLDTDIKEITQPPKEIETTSKIAEEIGTDTSQPLDKDSQKTTLSTEKNDSEEVTKMPTVTEPSMIGETEEQTTLKSPGAIEFTTIKITGEIDTEPSKQDEMSHETTVQQQDFETEDSIISKFKNETSTESSKPDESKPLGTTKSPEELDSEETTTKVTKETSIETTEPGEFEPEPVTQTSQSDKTTSKSSEKEHTLSSDSHSLEKDTTTHPDTISEITTQSIVDPDSKVTEPSNTNVNAVTTGIEEQSQPTQSYIDTATEHIDKSTTISSVSLIHKEGDITSISDHDIMTESPLDLITKHGAHSEETISSDDAEATTLEIDLSISDDTVTKSPKEPDTHTPDKDIETTKASVNLDEITSKPTSYIEDDKTKEDISTKAPVLLDTEKDTISEVTTSKPSSGSDTSYEVNIKTEQPEIIVAPKDEQPAETFDKITTESSIELDTANLPVDSEKTESYTDKPFIHEPSHVELSEMGTLDKDKLETETPFDNELTTFTSGDGDNLTESPINIVKEPETTQYQDINTKSTESEEEAYTKEPMHVFSDASDKESFTTSGQNVVDKLTTPVFKISEPTTKPSNTLTNIPTEYSVIVDTEKPIETTQKESPDTQIILESTTSSDSIVNKETEAVVTEISIAQEFSTKQEIPADVHKLSTESPKETYTEASEKPVSEKIHESVTESVEKVTKDTEIITHEQEVIVPSQPTATESAEHMTKVQDQEDYETVELATGITDSNDFGSIRTTPSIIKTTTAPDAIGTSTPFIEIITSQPGEEIVTSTPIEDESIMHVDKENTEIPVTVSDQQTVEIVTRPQPVGIDMTTIKHETTSELIEEEFIPSKTGKPEMYPTTLTAAEEFKKSTQRPAVEEASTTSDQTLLTSIDYNVTEAEQSATTIVSDFHKTHSPEVEIQTEKVAATTENPLLAEPSPEITTIQEEKLTTAKAEELTTTFPVFDKFSKPTHKPSEAPATEQPKPIPTEKQPTDDLLTPDEEPSIPPSGTSGYGSDPDYMEEDQTFGPGTCRYGGKVYVSAQQIPRDDPCDFCFCFRSDIICLQQSCPPPIHGCHEEPISGFCCPRYECPVSMATTVNVTTTTTTTTTTVPPHFPVHSYKGSAQKRGCLIKGHTYKVGEVVRASSGPCLHCTCGGDGQMKCDPKQCTPEPMLRQMIAAAVSAKRRR